MAMASITPKIEEASKKAARLGRLKFYAFFTIFMLFSWRHISDSPEIEGIVGSQLIRKGVIRRNPATIAMAKFFAHVIAGSIGFRRVVVLAIRSVRKGGVDAPRFLIYGTLFYVVSPHNANSRFQMYRTHRKVVPSLVSYIDRRK